MSTETESLLNWKRPENVKFPSVWRRFEGQKPFPNGKKPRFRIQDATDDLTDGIMRLMVEQFLEDEPISASLDISKDEMSKEEMRYWWLECLKYKCVLACVLENKDELGDDSLPVVAGCNMTVPKEPGIHIEFQGTTSRTIDTFLSFCESKVDGFKQYDTDVVLYAVGLSVDRMFRGQGIGLELLKARCDMGRALGLKATLTIFTAIASQCLADKLQYDLLFEMPYDEYKVDGDVVFKNLNTKTVKYMGKRFI